MRLRELLGPMLRIKREEAEKQEAFKIRLIGLINQFDTSAEDKTKLEIAGRLISLIQKVML